MSKIPVVVFRQRWFAGPEMPKNPEMQLLQVCGNFEHGSRFSDWQSVLGASEQLTYCPFVKESE